MQHCLQAGTPRTSPIPVFPSPSPLHPLAAPPSILRSSPLPSSGSSLPSEILGRQRSHGLSPQGASFWI